MKKTIVITVALLFIFLLAGCQNNQGDTPEPPTATAVPPTEQSTEEPAAEATASEVVEAVPNYLQPRYEPLEQCFIEPPEELGITQKLDCGYIVVPEFYDHETDRPVKLSFIRMNADQPSGLSPLFVLLGGPGQSFSDPQYFNNFRPELLGNILQKRDIILLDQRGTKNTDTFLDCPEIYPLPWKSHEQGLDKEADYNLQVETLQKCIDDFKAQGIDLNAYNSVANAADVNAARQALGYDRIIYYGASYGSQLGQHVMRDFPEILEAVILDGANTLSRKSWVEDRALNAQWGIDNLTALCEADEKCNEAYDIPALLEGATALFADGPLTYTYTSADDPTISFDVELTEANLFDLIFTEQGSGITAYSLPAILWQINDGGASGAAELLGPIVGQQIEASRDLTEGSEAILMHLAMVCSDDHVASVDDVIVEGVSEYARVYGQNTAELYVLGCPMVDVQELPPNTDENVTLDVPTLLLAGNLDVSTPTFHTQQLADDLPTNSFVILPGRTHVQLDGANQCAGQIMTQFVMDPTGTLDTSCTEEPSPYSFILPDGSSSRDVQEDAVSDGAQEATGGAGESTLPEDITAQLDAYLQSQVYSNGGSPPGTAPGLVLYVETPDGIYLNAAGVANMEDGTPMQNTDILEIGSNTKSMTIVLLMQLVEEGLISLDDLLSQYLPEQAALLPNGDQITIRQMAQHTAGLYDYADNIIAAGLSDPAALEAGFAPAEMVQAAVDFGTPYFAPGEEGQWHYSNTGYILLGMIIESLTGESYGDLIQTRIFDPLGMESAVFLEGVPQEGQITTHGYWFENGEIIDTTNWNASQGWVAGAAAMTATDLATYARGLANGQLFQNPETLNEMLTFDPSAKFGVGGPYGLGLIDFAGDGTVWGHGGQTLGFQSLWYIQPETGIVVVGLTNSASYSSNAFLNVLNILEGKGAQPFGPITLLPIGDLVPTTWAWTQFVNPAESVTIDAAEGLTIDLARDKNVTVKSATCGEAYGTYTTDPSGRISFELDDSTITCDADSLAGQFVQHLKDAARWHFDNGNLIIELPADGGSLIFAIPAQ